MPPPPFSPPLVASQAASLISTEKSKVGLGEEYAQAYEQQVMGMSSAESAKTEAAHTAVRDLYAKLGAKLDALFNFHAVPKPHKAEAKVRANVAAVQMEEAMPTAMAQHQSLAPEEVYGKHKTKESLAARDELSQAERQALRRKKKRVRKRRTGERDEAVALRAKLEPDGNTAKRLEAQKAGAALADAKRKGTVLEGRPSQGGKDAGATGAQRAGQQFTRSAQFFKKMQDDRGSGGGAGAKRKRDSSGASPGEGASAKGAKTFKL